MSDETEVPWTRDEDKQATLTLAKSRLMSLAGTGRLEPDDFIAIGVVLGTVAALQQQVEELTQLAIIQTNKR